MDDSDSQSSSSTGSGAQKGSVKIRKIPYKLTPTKAENVGQLTVCNLTLENPSNLTEAPAYQQAVCMYILDATDVFSLRILRDMQHQNILHLKAFVSSTPTSIKICVESYSHTLAFEIAFAAQKQNGIKPGQLEGLLRQVVEGIDELRVYGFYHGNLSIHNTYYDKNTNLIKLANFKEKGEGYLKSQFDDWASVGNLVSDVAAVVQPTQPKNILLLNDLGSLLKKLPRMQIEEVKEKVLKHVFFWNKRRRASFFIHDILSALHIPDFASQVNKLTIIPSDWSQDDHEGIDVAMNNKFSADRHGYIKFLSAAYTHEEEFKSDGKIKSEVSIDAIIIKRYPSLCLELVKILSELGFDV